MRKLATIRYISEIKHIEGADLIEISVVDGWNCVVKKGDFEVRQMCIYFEIDSFLPIHPVFEFLRKNSYKKMDDKEGFRLKTIKLKGVYSQGLLVPIKTLVDCGLLKERSFYVNEDLTEELGIEKYEPPIPAQLSGSVKGNFPSFLIKTDEERCLSGDSNIITEDGVKTIKEICDTKYFGKILSYNLDSNTNEMNDIINHSIMNNNNDWYEIELENDKKIKLTSNHLVWFPELKCYREVKYLKNGDYLMITDD